MNVVAAETEKEPRRIAVVGGGGAAWTSAALLAAKLPAAHYRITVIPVENADHGIGAYGWAESALPPVGDFHASLEMDEDRLLRAARGSFSLGTAWSGWSVPQDTYFTAFGDVGAPLDTVAFHQLASRRRSEKAAVRLANFSLAAIAAQLGRFARPSSDPRSVLSTYQYGLHVDLDGYAGLMRAAAERAGAVEAAAPFGGAVRREDGTIGAISLRNGDRLQADLVIDASGTDAVVIGEALEIGWTSWSDCLPCDRVIAAAFEDGAAPPPYTHVSAHSAGWHRSIPLQGVRSDSLAFASALMSDEAAAAMLGKTGQPLREPRFVSVDCGRRELFWTGNCIAVGSAACLLEPLAGSGLDRLHGALARLIALLPGKATSPAAACEFNRGAIEEVERQRDFLLARYRTNGRTGEPLWDNARAVEAPEALSRKLALYRALGRVPMEDEETFEERDWVLLLDGQGVHPKRHDPLADAIPRERLERHMGRLREVILTAAAQLPTHADYVSRHCRFEARR